MNLADLQHQFSRAIHYQASGEECSIVSDVFSADERMQIYRNNFIISLSEVLQATYPMVQALLGEECFAQVARHHVLNQPLTRGDVTHYGEHFDHSLKQFDAVMQAAPYIAEVARFEWSLDVSQQLFSRNNSVQYDLVDLAKIPTEQHANIRFHLHPDVVLLTSPFAVYALQQAITHHDEQLSSLDIQQAQQGVCACNESGEVWSLALDQNSYQLLDGFYQQLTLGGIEPQCLSALNKIIELNLLAGFSLPPQLASE
ncbi:DNA-binding domain-containing protein [Vibrio kasasachensis]|uniref:HvfC/BufC family peptide modification chaperone n=1 Tax=Vibrio kasasachensis TaxID=2910248 RepID=UPI003D0EBF5E